MVVLIFNRLSVHTIKPIGIELIYDISLLPFLPLLFSPSLSPSLYITNRLLSMGTSGTQEEDAGINSKKGQEEGQGKGQGAPPHPPHHHTTTRPRCSRSIYGGHVLACGQAVYPTRHPQLLIMRSEPQQIRKQDPHCGIVIGIRGGGI